MRYLAGILVLCVLLLTSCAGRVSPEEYQRSYDMLTRSAQDSIRQGDYMKAFVLSEILLNHKPGDVEVMKVKGQALTSRPDLDRFTGRGLLGSNLAIRDTRNTGAIGKLLLWPVNVIVEALDVFTIEVGVAIGAGLKAQATDAVAVGAQLSLAQTMFGFRNRHFGSRAAIEEYLDIIFFQSRGMAETSLNTSGINSISYGEIGIKEPGDRIYQSVRDYWAVGAEAQLGIIAADVEIHPIQVWDWISTIFFFDPLNDNVGWTKTVNLGDDEILAIENLVRRD